MFISELEPLMKKVQSQGDFQIILTWQLKYKNKI
jgi:hypothetical protein